MPTLRELRLRAGLSQVELARRAGLRQATLSALENGRSRPHAATIAALAQALATDPAEVVWDEPSSGEPPARAGAIAQLGGDWAFLAGLAPDLRRGLAEALVAEWTHSSTALEGNTISAGDTLFVLTEGLTVSGKSLREHEEIHGHAQALALMAAWTRAGAPIRIEQLHELHRAVQTGTVIDCFAPVGRWKVEPNGTTVITSAGSTAWHEYARPQDVPALIAIWCQLLARHRKRRRATSARDPQRLRELVDAYTDLHLGLATIHPYADGNGRLARLLANIPLLAAGWPPLLVSAARRRDYLVLLGDYTLHRGPPRPGEDLVATGAEREALAEFFASQWRATLDLVAGFHRRQVRRSALSYDEAT